MTVYTTNGVVQYIGNGTTKSWPVTYRFFKNTDLVVVKRTVSGTSVPLLLNTDYTVTGAGGATGGTLTTLNPLDNGEFLTITRILPVVQATDLRNQGAYYAEVHEDEFDYLTMLIQQVSDGDSRALKHPNDQEHYEAEGRRIVDLEDPKNPQDAATMGWASNLITNLLENFTGSPNNTSNIFYDAGSLYDFLKLGLARNVNNIAALRSISGLRNQRAFVLGYYQPNDLGGGQYYLDPTDTTSLDNGGSIIVGTDGSRWKLKHNGLLSIGQFGAKSDDMSDNLTFINNTVNAVKALGKGRVYCPAGIFRVSGTISINVIAGNLLFEGAGRGLTIIRNTSANLPTIDIPTGSYYVTVQNLTLDRAVTATSGGNGLQFGAAGVAEGNIYRVHSTKNWNGFQLGGCSYNELELCKADYNKNDGFNITNSNVYSTCQWYFDGALSQLNDRDGFHVESVGTKTDTPSGGNMSVGELKGVRTFGNGRYGLAVIDNATVGIYGMRVNGYFFGEDNVGEIYLDVKGEDNMFNNGFVELAGMSSVGVGSLVGSGQTPTAASKNAFGIIITARVPDVGFDFLRLTGCSRSGIYSSTPKLRLSNARIKNCGAGTGTAPVDKSGIYINAGNMRAVNVDSTGQGYGSYNGSTGGDVYVGCDMRNNATGTIGGTTTNNRVDATTYA